MGVISKMKSLTCIHSWELFKENGVQKRKCTKCGRREYMRRTVEWVKEPEQNK